MSPHRLLENAHGGRVSESQKLSTAQMSLNRRMNKSSTLCLNAGILFSRDTATCRQVRPHDGSRDHCAEGQKADAVEDVPCDPPTWGAWNRQNLRMEPELRAVSACAGGAGRCWERGLRVTGAGERLWRWMGPFDRYVLHGCTHLSKLISLRS